MPPLWKQATPLVQLLWDLTLFVLMMTGIGGIIYQLIIPGGWGEHWISALWRARPTLAIMTLVFAALAFFLGRRWLHSLNRQTSAGNLFMYGWVLMGLYFIVRWLAGGML